MAASSGPVRTMPGTFYPLPEGALCDTHPQRRAICRIQGETDALGAEFSDCCAECRERVLLLQKERHYPGRCQLCGLFKENLKKWRDPNDGVLGPNYDVCEDCVEQQGSYMVRETPEGLVTESQEAAELREEVANMALDHFEHHPEPDESSDVEPDDEFLPVEDSEVDPDLDVPT